MRGYAVLICCDENVSRNVIKNLPLVANKQGICSPNININAIWVWAENTVNQRCFITFASSNTSVLRGTSRPYRQQTFHPTISGFTKLHERYCWWKKSGDHLGYVKPCKSWDKLSFNWCRVFFHQQYHFRSSVKSRQKLRWKLKMERRKRRWFFSKASSSSRSSRLLVGREKNLTFWQKTSEHLPEQGVNILIMLFVPALAKLAGNHDPASLSEKVGSVEWFPLEGRFYQNARSNWRKKTNSLKLTNS